MTRRLFPLLAVALALGAQRREALTVLAKFHGTLTGIDKKFVHLDLDGDNSLEFRRTGKTAFYKGKTRVKPGEIPPGSPVLVEGTKNLAGELIAASVIWDGKSEPVTRP
jgi:hypothetical protein